MLDNINRKRLLLIGGVSFAGVGVCYIVGTVLTILIGSAPSSAIDYFASLSSHKLLSLSNFIAFTIADVLLVPSVVALYLALKDVNKKAVTAASVLMLLFVVFDAGVTEYNSLQLVALTQNYSAATTEAQRLAYTQTANSLLSTLPVSTLLSFVISSVAVLIIGLVMLKSTFSRRNAILGVAIGVAGTLAGFYIFLPALSVLLSPSMFVFGVWCVTVGYTISKKHR